MGRHMTMGGNIGILVKTFPKISETFILHELLGLERSGLMLHIFSLYHPTESDFHSATGEVRSSINYVPPLTISQALIVCKTHLALLLRSPGAYLRTLGFLLRRREGKRLREFLRAGCLVKMLRRAGVVHLHAHYATEPAEIAELVQRLAGISYSISAHAKDIYLSHPAALQRKLGSARFTVTCTEYNRKYLESVADGDARVFRMYHGIDLERFCPGSSSNAICDDSAEAPLVLSVGRLREKKGFDVLIDSCRRLREAGVTLRCQIVGYGPERKRLEGLIHEWGLEGTVELVGRMTHDDLVGLYRKANCFVLSCQVANDGDRDGIPNVLLEAMAMQLPVVTTRVSGIPELIDNGKNGLLVGESDPHALAVAIRVLLDSPVLRKRLGSAGRETVTRMFSADRNIQLVKDLLLDATSSSSSVEASVAPGGEVYA